MYVFQVVMYLIEGGRESPGGWVGGYLPLCCLFMCKPYCNFSCHAYRD